MQPIIKIIFNSGLINQFSLKLKTNQSSTTGQILSIKIVIPSS